MILFNFEKNFTDCKLWWDRLISMCVGYFAAAKAFSSASDNETCLSSPTLPMQIIFMGVLQCCRFSRKKTQFTLTINYFYYQNIYFFWVKVSKKMDNFILKITFFETFFCRRLSWRSRCASRRERGTMTPCARSWSFWTSLQSRTGCHRSCSSSSSTSGTRICGLWPLHWRQFLIIESQRLSKKEPHGEYPRSVIFFSKLNELFSRYFDPVNTFFDNKNK